MCSSLKVQTLLLLREIEQEKSHIFREFVIVFYHEPCGNPYSFIFSEKESKAGYSSFYWGAHRSAHRSAISRILLVYNLMLQQIPYGIAIVSNHINITSHHFQNLSPILQCS